MRWTKEEEEKFRIAYQDNNYTLEEICWKFKRKRNAIMSKAHAMQIKRIPQKEDLPDGYKRCSKCKEVLSFEQFYDKRKAKDGKQPYCKTCKNKYNKEKKEENNKGITLVKEQKFIVCSRCNEEKLYTSFDIDKKTGKRKKTCRKCYIIATNKNSIKEWEKGD
ncbi:hypothetical protein [Romboutsia sp.]|uniref:hypothetical protein n=1 Tax=Romboutsia sp. TaxID=1965302 RepID=UPI002CA44E77|nr:hypothetical protein [Romboutsia sp.]HSQ87997.1 hypothetical protein [Romboutsia sp.]